MEDSPAQIQLILSDMLVRQEKKLQLTKPAQKILCLSSAYDNSYVFTRVDQPGAQESIVHVDAQGNILFQQAYQDVINEFGMLNEREVIVLNVAQNKIDVVSLKEQAVVVSLNHQFLFEDVAQMRVETFYEKRLFCVVEHGTSTDHRLRLTYYEYDNLQSDSPPFAEYISAEGEWTYEMPVEKVNTHSKMAWWKVKHRGDVEFRTYDLKEQERGKLTTVKGSLNPIQAHYNMNGLELTVGKIWESKPNVYTLVCFSNKAESEARNEAGVINNNYILDSSTGIIRETSYHFKLADFSWNDQLVDFYSFGPVSAFHTFKHENGQTIPSPVFYIDNDTEQIIAQETWKADCYTNYYQPGFDSATMIEAIHDNGEVSDITVITTKFMHPKEVYLHFLLHINEDFDDDLLKDAIELLEE